MSAGEQYLDTIFDAYADYRRRRTLTYLREASTATADAIADHISRTEPAYAIELRRTHLPVLADANLLEYDDTADMATINRYLQDGRPDEFSAVAYLDLAEDHDAVSSGDMDDIFYLLSREDTRRVLTYLADAPAPVVPRRDLADVLTSMDGTRREHADVVDNMVLPNLRSHRLVAYDAGASVIEPTIDPDRDRDQLLLDCIDRFAGRYRFGYGGQ